MPRYEKGTLGKLSVQDWDIVSSYDDEPRLYILTRQQAAALLGMTDFLHWLTRWKNPPTKDVIDAFASETEFNLMNPITCEMLTECLQPLFDDLVDRIDAIETGTNTIADILEANGASAPAPITRNIAGERCGGAAFVVDFMDFEIRRVYAEAEEGLLDNLVEATVEILRAIPIIESLPFDEMINAINIMFENQVADYITDFDTLRDDLIGSLACFIEANSNAFNYQVWGDWLVFVGEEYPTNRAAMLFSAFAPVRQTFASDILAGVFNRPTLRAWFDTISAEYTAGSQVAISCPTYTCPTTPAENVGLFTLCGTGAQSTVAFTDGVPFDVVAYEITVGAVTSWEVALRLPAGNWEITLNSIDGTITSPDDPAETAYAWIDTSGGFHNVLWNAPATIEDFGVQETTQGIFALWCASQNWNAYLHNKTAFTANFTVTAI